MPTPKQLKLEIVKAYQKAPNADVVAAKYGISSTTVLAWSRQLGFTNGKHNRAPPLDDELFMDIWHACDGKLNKMKAALGISRERLIAEIDLRGLPRRTCKSNHGRNRNLPPGTVLCVHCNDPVLPLDNPDDPVWGAGDNPKAHKTCELFVKFGIAIIEEPAAMLFGGNGR
jgi:hypothetical protein